VAFSPDGKTLASAGDDQTIRLWETATGKEIRRLTGHQSGISSVAFSPDGKRLASACADGTLLVWDLSRPRRAGRADRSTGGAP
jgi:WD40 repeat protein